MDTSILLDVNDWILRTFNKEGILIFCAICVCFFGIASMLAYWGFNTGQFKDIEEAKLEMMDC